jgi:hypothetical protein
MEPECCEIPESELETELNDVDHKLKKEKAILAENAWHLARYLMEHDDRYNVAEKIDMGAFLLLAERYPSLTNSSEKKKFINEYDMLEKIAGNVTARTLRATRIHDNGFFYAVRCTSVGKYLAFLSVVTFVFVILLFLPSVIDVLKWKIAGKELLDTSAPFAAAGFGTCVYLLRVTQQKLVAREFDPAFVPSQMIRLIMGVFVVGSIVVIFPDFFKFIAENTYDFKTGNASDESTAATVSTSALFAAFLMGYAIDILYAFLDRFSNKLQKDDRSATASKQKTALESPGR